MIGDLKMNGRTFIFICGIWIATVIIAVSIQHNMDEKNISPITVYAQTPEPHSVNLCGRLFCVEDNVRLSSDVTYNTFTAPKNSTGKIIGFETDNRVIVEIGDMLVVAPDLSLNHIKTLYKNGDINFSIIHYGDSRKFTLPKDYVTTDCNVIINDTNIMDVECR